MFAARIHLYIVREALSPTLICLLIYTMVLLMGRLMKLVALVINKGVAVADIVLLFSTMLPAFLSSTLPFAFLMGLMIGLSRMSADNETVALKSAGFGLVQMARPVLALALVFTLLTAAASLWLKPWGYQAFRKQVFDITMQKATIGFQSRVFMQQFDQMVLYANDIDDRSGRMSGLFIVEDKPDANLMIFADHGDIASSAAEESVTVQLRDGTIHRQVADRPSAYQMINFRNYDVRPELPGIDSATRDRIASYRRPKELSTAELWRQIGLDQETVADNSRHALVAELHSRFATPLAPLIFALFGLPFSIQSSRSGRSGGFVIGLFIYLCYYLALSLGQTFTADAGLPPLVTIWLPHLLLAAVGLYCLQQNAQERPNILVAWIENSLLTVRERLSKHDENA